MRFVLLLYCATVHDQLDIAYDCVSLSVHGDHQEAVNAAHEWCVYDHVCVHHTYLKEVELGAKVHHVATGRQHEASSESADTAPGAADSNAPKE